ncbi:MAG: thioredoxin-disulfide reductase [Candidatus Marinimicrobia bacterium]|nr:thioredoxin-disulfide reductase [Candidatus Neomarinimicrobiota bacterium]MCF7828422.1 thioredoxin-disulfide reductase [Candidatus Neomarinimicrobiota bacterium]MCF7880984.1 thioredoxin-disulfide reductase [Candidatus Neomarinimicrobiota bacterium]
MSDEVRNVIIIGSGAAGLTAAIYNARADLEPLVFEGEQPGGQLTITTDVENYPGFPEGIMGPDMMDAFRKQAQKFGAETHFKHVTKVDFSERPFKVWVGDDLYKSHAVIVATGATAKTLKLENEDELMGYGVSACATCDGFFFKDQEVIVVGGGDSAMEEGTYLTKFAKKVYIAHRRDELRASKIMADRANKNEKIEFLWNTEVAELHGNRDNGGLKSVTLLDNEKDETREMEIDGLFYAIGHKPNTDIFEGMLDMDDKGYLITQPDNSYTNIDGVFACGDVQDSVYRQAVTAAGSGCKAAIDAERWLAEQE